MNYATLYQLRSYLGLADDETADDVRLSDFLRRSSAWIDWYSRRRFDVRIETRKQDFPKRPRSTFGQFGYVAWMVAELAASNDLNAGRLRLNDDFLECTNVVNGDGNALLPTDYVLEDAALWPKYALQLVPSSGKWWQVTAAGNWEQMIPVTGVWGYHDAYPTAWADSLDTVQNDPITSGSTGLLVSDADGPSEDRIDQRFQAGQILRIESEFLAIAAVDTTTNTLLVKRGANGSTAGDHSKGTPIYIYRPMGSVEQAALRLATWAYRQKDVSVFERVTIIGTSQSVMPGAIPADVVDLLPAPKPMGLK